MGALKLFLIILFVVGTGLGQELPDAPRSQKIVTWDFVVVHAVQGVGAGLDTGFSNARLTSPNRVCREGNYLFSNRDGSFNLKKAIISDSSTFTGLLVMDYFARRIRRDRWIRGVMNAIVLGSSVGAWRQNTRWLTGNCK